MTLQSLPVNRRDLSKTDFLPGSSHPCLDHFRLIAAQRVAQQRVPKSLLVYDCLA